jgi:hypothetical protein
LAIFKLILRFANGPKAGSLNGNQAQWKRELALGNYIVHKGIVREQLRDEIYCQICNQTWRNEDPEAVARCWYLMANCLSAFPPSPVLYKYLLKYIRRFFSLIAHWKIIFQRVDFFFPLGTCPITRMMDTGPSASRN